MRVQLKAPAKLNLFLHITGRLPNGYHQLQTLFRAINLYDDIDIIATNDSKLTRLQGLDDVQPEQDLVIKAARALKPFAASDAGAQISVFKRIPTGAGLGGGSSDAAAVLVALNKLWQCELSQPKLCQIAQGLGADVPFFIAGGDQWAEGIGELLQPVQWPAAHYVIVYPNVHCNTATLFANERLQRHMPAIDFAQFQQGVVSCNAFEPVVLQLYPEVQRAHQWLTSEAGNARLTGSGSALFAEVANHQSAVAISNRCPKPWLAFYARSLLGS